MGKKKFGPYGATGPSSSFCSSLPGGPPLALEYTTTHDRWNSSAQTFSSKVWVGRGQLSQAYQFVMSMPACKVPVTEEEVKKCAEAKYESKLAKALAGLAGEGLVDTLHRGCALGKSVASPGPRPLPVMDPATQMSLHDIVWASSDLRALQKSEDELESYENSTRQAQVKLRATALQPQVAAALVAAPPGFSSAPPGGAAREHVDLLSELAQLRPGGPRGRWEKRSLLDGKHGCSSPQPKQLTGERKQKLVMGLGDIGLTQLMAGLPGVSQEVAKTVLARGANRYGGSITSPRQQMAYLQLAERIADDPAGYETTAAEVPLFGFPLAPGNGGGVRIALFNEGRTHDISGRAKCATSCGPGLNIPDEVHIPDEVWQGCLKKSGLTDFARNKVGQLMRTSPAAYREALDLVKGRAPDTSGLHLYLLTILHIQLREESSQAGAGQSQPAFSAKTVAACLPGGDLPPSAHADYKATQEAMFGGAPMADLILQQAMDSTDLASNELKVCVMMTCPTAAETYAELHEDELLTMLQLDNKVAINSRIDAWRLPSLSRRVHGGGDAEGPDEATVEDEEVDDEDEGGRLEDMETLEAWDIVGEEPAPSPSGPGVKVRKACAVTLETSYVGLTRQVGGILTRARQHFSTGRNALARAVRLLLGSQELASGARKAAAAAQAASAQMAQATMGAAAAGSATAAVATETAAAASATEAGSAEQ